MKPAHCIGSTIAPRSTQHVCVRVKTSTLSLLRVTAMQNNFLLIMQLHRIGDYGGIIVITNCHFRLDDIYGPMNLFACILWTQIPERNVFLFVIKQFLYATQQVNTSFGACKLSLWQTHQLPADFAIHLYFSLLQFYFPCLSTIKSSVNCIWCILR